MKLGMAAIATFLAFTGAAASAQESLTPEEARAIAREAYIFGFPLVDSYRILHSYFVDRSSLEYKAGWNEKVASHARVFTAADLAMQSPNADTPCSHLGLDLRAEPMVLSMPAVEKGRYYSAEVNDLYTCVSGYIGSRTTGNDAGDYLIAGPDWKGEKPPGIKAVIPCETHLAFVFYRTQLFRPQDIENVKKIQARYQVQPLSTFLGKPAPSPPPALAFVRPISAPAQRSSLHFFAELNFVLGLCPTPPSEIELMSRFAKLNIGGDKSFDPGTISPEIRKAIEEGRADAWREHDDLLKRVNTGEIASGDLLGTRESLKHNYLYRMHGAVAGIWATPMEEAIYSGWDTDSTGRKLDGSKGRYQVRFGRGELPPVNAFWSMTMYEMPSQLLVANPINRYLINSPMLPDLKKDADGGVTILIQRESPGAKRESNWLPAPDGPFVMVLRMYWPKPEALDGRWKKPALQPVK